jgi:spore coat polysaccharide biosynthesis protein SpsF
MSGIAIVIQARMGSSRFPGKVLKMFCGKSMLIFQIELLRSYGMGIPVIVATSISPDDDAIVSVCSANGIPCYRGSVDDVFSRYCYIARDKGLEDIVRLTADNPLTDHRILSDCIEEHSRSGADLTSTRRILPGGMVERYTPKGNSVDIISAAALLGIDPYELSDSEKEHVIPVFFNGRYKVSFVRSQKDKSFSYSVDNPEDLVRVEGYAAELLRKKKRMVETEYEAGTPCNGLHNQS